MRLSIIHTDPGFSLDALYHEVFVNGVKVGKCYTADEEEGRAWCYGDDGQTIMHVGKVELRRIP